MNTRKVKDAKDISTNELIYFKGHAKATYMSDGTAVEDAIPTKVSQLTNDSGYITSDDLNFSGSAEDITFDPADTGLSSTNVQDAIAEVKEAGVTDVTISVDNTSGIPSASAVIENQVLKIELSGLKGEQGNSGFQGDFTDFEVVNNLTDGGADKALSAEMGKRLTEKVTEVKDETSYFIDTENSSHAKAYEEGILELFLSAEKIPDITSLEMWGYIYPSMGPTLNLRYINSNGKDIYLIHNLPFDSISNFEQININIGGENIGYVILKDKQRFIDFNGAPKLLNIKKVLRGALPIPAISITTEKIANNAITTGKVANNAITIEKTDFIELRTANKQLYDKSSMGVSGSWYYGANNASPAIGKEVALITNQYTGSYTAIKIPIHNKKQVTVSQSTGAAYAYSYFFVDEHMVALDFKIVGSSEKLYSGLTLNIPDGTVYLLLSIARYNEDLFMVTEGSVAIPYEPYREETYVNGINISTRATDTVDISLPDTIHAVVGDTLQLFYRGIIKAVNPYNYDILVTCSKGSQYPRYYEFTPTSADIGSVPFRIAVKDNNQNIIAEKSCTIEVVRVASSPSSEKKILCFGDSLTTAGIWVSEVYRRLTSTGGTPSANGLTNIYFSGAKNKDGAGYFGEGGWSWSSYTTQGRSAYRFKVSGVVSLSVGSTYSNNGNTFTILEINVTNGAGDILCLVSSLTPTPSTSGTLTKTSGNGDDTISFTSYSRDSANPLWDYDSGKMTFIPYAEKYADGNIDIVYTLLSWNGLSAGMTDFSSIISQIKIFADTLHSEFPSAKLKIMGIQVPSVNGGMGANYGATGISYADGYGMVVTALNMNKAYQDFANESGYSDFVEFVNVSSQFDSENNMPYRETKVNTRSTLTEKRGTNGVHPSTDGYMQIADIVYRNIMASL